jgi:SAP domain-containing ribonucleoprotein
MPASSAEEEARKRAERAKRFGVVESEEDMKLTDRAKRFGIDQSSIVSGLDSALPERPLKRGRDRGDGEGRAEKRQSVDRQDRRRGQRGGRHGRGGGGGGDGGARSQQGGNRSGGGGRAAPKKGPLDDPAEKAKAEARAKRFGGS